MLAQSPPKTRKMLAITMDTADNGDIVVAPCPALKTASRPSRLEESFSVDLDMLREEPEEDISCSSTSLPGICKLVVIYSICVWQPFTRYVTRGIFDTVSDSV